MVHEWDGLSLAPLESGNSSACSQECVRITVNSVRAGCDPGCALYQAWFLFQWQSHGISQRKFEEDSIYKSGAGFEGSKWQ